MVSLPTWCPLDPAVILLPNILVFIALWIIQECAHVVSACFLIPFTKLFTFFLFSLTFLLLDFLLSTAFDLFYKWVKYITQYLIFHT